LASRWQSLARSKDSGLNWQRSQLTTGREASGSVFHPLSLQQARHYNIPAVGTYLAHAGYMLSMAGVGAHCLITAVDGKPVRRTLS
jgi:hypothetical protein